MLNMTLAQIRDITGGKLIGNDALIHQVVTDSRQVASDTLFVALKGESFDGHDFLLQAQAKGAAGALVERHVECALPQVIVSSNVKAIADVARAHRRLFKGIVFAITGSCGKTSTKEMLAGILSEAGNVLATRGNQNNEIGVPLTLFNMEESQDYTIVEMGAAQKGDIAYLMDIAEPDITAITNVGSAHIGRFGNERTIADTKAEIYACLKASGKAVVNLDVTYSDEWMQMLVAHDVKTFSINKTADVYASDIACDAEVSRFELHHGGDSRFVTLAVPGKHNVANAVCAAAMALHAGINLDQVVAGLSKFVSVSSRLEKREGFWGGVLIDDCYNANPASVRAAIDVLSFYPGNKVLVLGDMAELGDVSFAAHAGIGKYAHSKGVHHLFTCGVMSEAATQAFGENAQHFSDKKVLIELLKAQLKAGDVVLVKGSRAAALEEVIQSIVAKVSN